MVPSMDPSILPSDLPSLVPSETPSSGPSEKQSEIWNKITHDNFEQGWGNFAGGGSDATRLTTSNSK